MATPVHIEPSRRVLFDRKADFAANVQPSSPVNLRGYALRGVIVPAGWNGTSLTFKAAPSEITDANLTAALSVFDDAGNAVTVTIAASRYVVFGTEVAEKLNALGDFIIVINNATQAAAASLTLVCVASTK